MSVPRVARRCWDERTVNSTNRIPGDGTAWPLASMSLAQIHKWQKAIVNLRIHGHVKVTYDPFTDVAFDFKLKDVPGYVVPTELSHLSKPGLFADINVAPDGSIGGEEAFVLRLYIGRANDIGETVLPVLYNGGSRFLPFYFQIDSIDADTGAVNTLKEDPTDDPSAVTLTFNGESVALFDNNVAGGPTGAVTIEIPAASAAFLTWSGLRNADTGHFTTNSI